MAPSIALFVWFILLVGLLCFDPAKDPGTSVAVWVPVAWMFFAGSRLPSQWFGRGTGSVAQALEDGNPLDRTVSSVLILLAIVILISRSFKWGDFFARNLALMTLLSFALLSVFWSDFPFISFKRWFRDLGNYIVILVVLSDPRPLEAVRALLRRVCYLLIPLCILLNRYYPNMGKQYDFWSGVPMYVGATTSKNMLGVLCLVSGIFFFWDTVTRWADRGERRTRKIIVLNLAFLAMTLWQLSLCNSATSQVCLAIGCLVILTAHSKPVKRHPSLLKVLIPVCFCAYLILAYGFNFNGELASTIGRDPTLTGRSNIWNAVLSVHTNPIIGAGYQSFWLGPRLARVWALAGRVNEAHNGYLETYLNLGLVGVSLLCVFLIASYRTICRKFATSSSLATLGLALWTIVLFYNMTEAAAFNGQFLWVAFLLVTITLSPRVPVVHEAFHVKKSGSQKYSSKVPDRVAV
jgi:exopolysaccharide production protein ExoQ